MLSECNNTVLVSKAMTLGACDFLVKPVRLEELKIIWQHVLRQKSQFVWSLEPHRNFVAAVNQLGLDSMFFTLSATQTIFISYQFPRALPNFISHFTLLSKYF